MYIYIFIIGKGGCPKNLFKGAILFFNLGPHAKFPNNTRTRTTLGNLGEGWVVEDMLRGLLRICCAGC